MITIFGLCLSNLKTLLFLLPLVACTNLNAQYVGLGQKEIRELRDLLKGDGGGDGSAKKLYDSLLQLALGALRADLHPIDTIRTEGLLQGDPRKTATQSALQDMRKMYALALVYRVSGNRRYLDKAAIFLQAWAAVNHPKGDPIDDTNLDPAIEAFDMLKEGLTAEQATAIRDWLRLTAETELTAIYNRQNRATSHNNWHSHRLKIVGEIGYAIGDTALEGYAIRGLMAQIGTNLNPDGSSADFLTRDALHYHVYDLEPLLKLAIVIRRATGADYYSWQASSGSSIRRSVEWLLPYLNGQKTHPEFVNSTVEFDRRRAQNGEAAYRAGTLFDPKNGVAVLVLAAYFDPEPELMPLARRLIGSEDHYPVWQAVVNALMTVDGK
jgi:Alginate lyase